MNDLSSQAVLSQLLRERRSVRDFRPDAVDPAVIEAILDDAHWSPSWSNTQPYRLAVASGALRDQISAELCERYDLAMQAQSAGWLGKLKLLLGRKGLPDGDLKTNFPYPADLQPQRRQTGFGLYSLLGIDRNDHAARERQMRRNFEFFGAPVVTFLFAHRGLREFSVLDTGVFLQSLMLSAQAHGLATCAQGALATWGGPVRAAFAVPAQYQLVCGLSLGHASRHAVNGYNPGRRPASELTLPAARH
ncbi:MAG: nitroreductase [Lysobacterales bacterium]